MALGATVKTRSALYIHLPVCWVEEGHIQEYFQRVLRAILVKDVFLRSSVVGISTLESARKVRRFGFWGFEAFRGFWGLGLGFMVRRLLGIEGRGGGRRGEGGGRLRWGLEPCHLTRPDSQGPKCTSPFATPQT